MLSRYRVAPGAPARAGRSGALRLLCGHLVRVCALETPPGRPCGRCAELIEHGLVQTTLLADLIAESGVAARLAELILEEHVPERSEFRAACSADGAYWSWPCVWRRVAERVIADRRHLPTPRSPR